ncbi:MAG TPA: hypothetical protein VGF45_21075 [Polyangia bacterium]
MKRSGRRQPKPRVSRAKWSTALTRVGAKVKLTAELVNNDPSLTAVDLASARFIIHEYSGKPPQRGGGFHLTTVETIDVDVEAGASSVTATWKVELGDEPAADGEVPEYRFTVLGRDQGRLEVAQTRCGHQSAMANLDEAHAAPQGLWQL